MAYDFDKTVNRRGTRSEKWAERHIGTADALPMWVADMDFEAPPEVTEAMAERLAHGVYGYSYTDEQDYAAAVNWRMARCGHEIKREWITFSSGVVCSIKAAVQAFASPGDAVVVQTPVYPPFQRIPTTHGRRIVTNPLIQGEDGVWRMDFDGLEACFRAGARMMLLCASHNPVGRVWTAEELSALAALCERYNVLVVADEIHCDIIRPGGRHTALAALPGMRDRVITLISSTKSFNLAGLQNSVAVTADPAMKDRLERELFRANHNTPNLFGMIAQRAAWTRGGQWLDELNAYIAANCDRALEMLSSQDRIVATKPQGTYLLWVDCRALGLPEEALLRFFVEKCRVFPTMGKAYGAEGFVRINLATRRALVEEGIGRILDGLATL